MNILNKWLLKVILMPAGLYTKWGINSVMLHSILRHKLLMDDRQPNTLKINFNPEADEEINNATLFTIVFSFVLGLLFLISFFIGINLLLQGLIFYSIFIVMLSLAVIVDFSKILLDDKDNYIILPKPVNDRTFIASRLLHILIHLSKLAIPMALPSVVLVLVKYGVWQGVVFTILTIAAILFSIFLINAFYLGILRFTHPERFKNIISYIQIGLVIGVYGGYQILPHIISESLIEALNISGNGWFLLYPPYWFASAWALFTEGLFTYPVLIGAIFSIGIPIIGMLLVLKYFGPSFNRKLASIHGSGGSVKKSEKTGKKSVSIVGFFSKWLTQPGEERMGFEFTWKMMLRSRDFKLLVYPSLGYLIVIMVVSLFTEKNLSFQSFGIESFNSIILLYGLLLIILTCLSAFHMSPLYKAGWIYKMSPTNQPGKIIQGSIKAIIAQFMIIPMGFIAAFGFYINGFSFLEPLFASVSLQFLTIYLLYSISGYRFPFSFPQTKAGGELGLVMTLYGLLSIIIVVLIHYFCAKVPYALWGAGLLGLAATYVLQRKLLRIKLQSIEWE
jgi:hypothetical protein